jgi:DNA-binding transcriptional MerR regulator
VTAARKGHPGARETDHVQLTLTELANRSASAERTIRYYIARGILAGPVRRGRGAFYSGEHLARLGEIRRQQERGRTLAEIERDAHGREVAKLTEPEAWWLYPVSADVLVQVRGGISPWRARAVKSALAKLARQLSSGDTTERRDDES